MDEKDRKLKLSLRFVPARRVIENSKKIVKKFKKLKNSTMASFQAKIGWKMPGKREYKKVSFSFLPTRREIENSKKIITKLEKIKNTIMASFQAKIGWKRMRKRENKN